MYQILLFVGMQRRTKASEAEFPGIVWMRVLALFCLLLPFVASLPVWGQSEPNISGKWQGTFDIPVNDGTFQHDTAFFILNQSGALVTGSAGRAEDMQTTVTDGHISEGRVQFAVVVRPGTTVIFNLRLEGDHLRGQATGLPPNTDTTIDVDTTRVAVARPTKLSDKNSSALATAGNMPLDAASLSARMEEIIRPQGATEVFMGTVLVAKNNNIILNRGYGSADLEWKIPNSPTTKFRIGSITKQFTAASILLLEERGRLKLSDPVSKYIPDVPASWRDITIFQLLTHTSGIVSITTLPPDELALWKSATPVELIARLRDKPLEFAPGSQAKYSNSGYILLGYIVEKVSGEAYASFLQHNIFGPPDMKDSGVDSNPDIVPRRAVGYRVNGQDLKHAEYIDMSIPFGAGDVYSTTEDLRRWEEGLFRGNILHPESLRKMTTPYKENFGLGVVVTNEDGHKLISHTGGIQGFVGDLRYYPDDRLTVIVLGNSESKQALEIAQDLSRLALENTQTHSAQDAAGTWSGSFIITMPNGQVVRDTAVLVLRQTGTLLTGTAGSSIDKQTAIEEGRVEADSIHFRMNVGGGMVFVLHREGKTLRGEGTSRTPEGLLVAKVDATFAPELKSLLTEIKEADVRLFSAYNRCDVSTFSSLFVKDLEFFHDTTGLTDLRWNVDALTKRCAEKTKYRRELDEDSLQVYAIPGYGAMELGMHRFYERGDGTEKLDASPRFMNIWKKEPDGWKLARVISYDHQ
jgi:CubicO group peptidase (beta-lactamase class C family)/ketosteroid isomerase-like protein